MATLSLGQRPKLRILLDDRDLSRVLQRAWRVRVKPTGDFQILTSNRVGELVRNQTLANFILSPKKGTVACFRDPDSQLDYRRQNLFCASASEVAQMRRKCRASLTSRFKGVSYVHATDSWRAQIEVKGHSIYLGTFETEGEAAAAYDEAVTKYFCGHAPRNQK